MADRADFLQIIDATPLVSIDLVVRAADGRVLLGQRNNRPAQGYWFVPGGRIRKNETRAEALKRISLTELGVELALDQGRLLGIYDHIYPDNYYAEAGINTHYVVLAYGFELAGGVVLKRDEQHAAFRWWNEAELLADRAVHPNTQAYFAVV
ncbi:GDP-mannose mannosyl hydrolase [Motiliproteus sediminis]|uniref:GDP-mannose mannosyl hydrolase n=1 Tax=Motiliproteus sediminis TaxID=1468178 RepID=UPI001AEF8F79|nr:GDP-mannose mannosyl hydrolase [Motiliproteus sediminis]